MFPAFEHLSVPIRQHRAYAIEEYELAQHVQTTHIALYRLGIGHLIECDLLYSNYIESD